jgi:protein gp37
MNKQDKGNGKRGIEWTDYTWNPVAGCKHGCQWVMPDNSVARCYAQDVAEGVASAAYPDGFSHHYWKQGRLREPLKIKEPSRIFVDSMSDLFGAWVPVEHIEEVFTAIETAYWHDFQVLTKNPGRILKFADQLPGNLWIGVSMPPSMMNGQPLTDAQQSRYMAKTMQVFNTLVTEWHKTNELWLSLEPLSFDVAPLIDFSVLDWVVIGAASNGKTKYQPVPDHVQHVLDQADASCTPVFFKGNLEWNPRREQFPLMYELYHRRDE